MFQKGYSIEPLQSHKAYRKKNVNLWVNAGLVDCVDDDTDDGEEDQVAQSFPSRLAVAVAIAVSWIRKIFVVLLEYQNI